MRAVGFSTGAVAHGDFLRALELLESTDANAVELSALRISELEPLMSALAKLDLQRFRHVSVHAPSSFSEEEEEWVIQQLLSASERKMYVVVHPDCMYNVEKWKALDSWLCVENMDKRKPMGRTSEELRKVFMALPKASLCFDIAHARQFDSSMTEAYRILSTWGERVRQVHISEVNTASQHSRVSPSAASDFAQVAKMIPRQAAVIVESQVPPEDLSAEMATVSRLMDPDGVWGAK